MKAVSAALLMSALCVTSASANSMLEHIEWIVDNSDFTYNGEPLPEVLNVDPRLAQILVYGEVEVARAEMTGATLPEVEALFIGRENIIVLSGDAGLDDWDIQHVIVHELVHYLQWLDNGHEVDCLPSLEPPAYNLHSQWMDEHDHPGDRPDPLFVALIGMACHRPEF